MKDDVADPDVAAVRAFNRFYTRKLGVLDQHLLQIVCSRSPRRGIFFE